MTYIHSSIKMVLLLGTVFGLSSCLRITISDEKTSSVPGTLARSGTPYVIANYRQPQDAFVEMPFEAGDIIAVTQKNYTNGVSQRVVFRSGSKVDGENHILVRATKKRNYSKNTKSKLKVHTNEYRELVRDFKKEFPGRPFSLNNRPERNAYGVFGHVYFRDSSSTNCIFAWQNAKSKALNTTWIERVRKSDVELSLRYRFCGNNMEESAAIAAITRVTIKLDPDDMRNNQEYLWRTKEDDIGYLSSDDPASEAYVSSEVEGGVQYLDKPDVIRKRKRKKTVSKVATAKPAKAERISTPKNSNIFVPPPQDEFTNNEVRDPEMRQRLDNVELLSPAAPAKPKVRKLPEPLPKLDSERNVPMVKNNKTDNLVPSPVEAELRESRKKVRVVSTAANAKVTDRIAIPLPDDR